MSGGLLGPSGESVSEKQAAVRKQRDGILEEAFAAKPALREDLERAVGYATFRQTDVNLFLLASGNGYGVLVDRRTGTETFMRVASLGGGVGMGVKDLRLLVVFRDEAVLRQFLHQGWQIGGKADAAAKYRDTGVSAEQNVRANVDVEQGTVAAASSTDARAGTAAGNVDRAGSLAGGAIEFYQFTASGIALQATVQGTKFWKDSKLNP
jgi:lipid-binding SYLF domain-containing protein